MDFSSTIYDSTVHDNFFTPSADSNDLTAAQMNAFMNQLLSTIDLATLGSVYYHQLCQYLPLASLSLADFANNLLYGRIAVTHASDPVISLPVTCAVNPVSESQIHYTFYHAPTRSERRMLNDFHKLFCQQLAHALAFYRMKQMATKDTLTGLGNRNGFNEACARLLSRAQRTQEHFGLLVIDLDNFKAVNDTLGHQEGDQVLIAVAKQINLALRGGDEAFRFGGDEFCCLLNCGSPEELNLAANRLIDQIAKSAYLRKVNVSCSIGGAYYRSGDDPMSLFERADTALYKVKQSGKDAYQAA